MPDYHKYWAQQSVQKSAWVHGLYNLSTSCTLLDSGASVHAVNSRVKLADYKLFDEAHTVNVRVGDGSVLKAVGSGSLYLKTMSNTYTLCDVLHVPELTHNVISVSQLATLGLHLHFSGDSCKLYTAKSGAVQLYEHDKPVLTAKLVDGLYLIDIDKLASVCVSSAYVPDLPPHISATIPDAAPHTSSNAADIPPHLQPPSDTPTPSSPSYAKLLHDRLGHPSKSTLKYMYKHNTAHNLPQHGDMFKVYTSPCEACHAGSFPAFPHKGVRQLPSAPCILLYADVMGPFPTAFDGSTYVLTCIDAYSGYLHVTIMPDKESVGTALPAALQHFSMHAPVQELRTDYGKEFDNAALMAYCAEHHIKLTHSAPYQHEQVGMIERVHRTIMNTTRSLLYHSGRSLTLWCEALQTAVYLYNIQASTSRDQKMSRLQLFTGIKPDISKLRVWGCKVLVKEVSTADKLQPKCVCGVFVGYDLQSPGYRVLLSGRVYVRHDVVFDEQCVGVNKVNYDCFAPTSAAGGVKSVPSPSASVQPSGGEEHASSSSKKRTARVFEPASPALHAKQDKRECVKRVRFADMHGVVHDKPASARPPLPVHTPGIPLPVPTSYAEAMSCEYSAYWQDAIQSELQSLSDMGVYEYVHVNSVHKHALTAKWVFSWKMKEGVVIKPKARLVARGFQQQYGIDYNLLYSPTISQSSIRLLLAHASSNSLYCHQLDFQTAFLNGALQEEVFLAIPDGAPAHPGYVWRLIKSLYGLKQAPKCWHQKLRCELGVLGFVPSKVDQALFYRHEQDGSTTYLCVHVDDMLIMNKSKSVVLGVVREIASKFKITDCGIAHEYLGLHIEHLQQGIFIHQSAYISQLLNKYYTGEIEFASTPAPPGYRFHKLNSLYGEGDEHVPFTDVSKYSSAVGALLYLCNYTRPDVCHTVSQLCKYMQNPSASHWFCVQYLLAYLKGTADMGILYQRGVSSKCIGYCDASFLHDPDTSKSVTGFCYLSSGGAIHWKSKGQSIVTTSTAEAEYIAMYTAGRFGVCLRELCIELHLPVYTVPMYVGEQEQQQLVVQGKKPAQLLQGQLIYTDNMSALHTVLNEQSSKHNTHIRAKYHYARERAADGTLLYEHVAGDSNVADVFTKSLAYPAFSKYRRLLGVVSKAQLH